MMVRIVGAVAVVLMIAACGSSSPSPSGNPYLQGTPTTRMYTAWEVSQDGTIILEITQPSPPASWPALNLTPDLGGPYTQQTTSPSGPPASGVHRHLHERQRVAGRRDRQRRAGLRRGRPVPVPPERRSPGDLPGHIASTDHKSKCGAHGHGRPRVRFRR